jgi:hypothetical protein
MMMRAEMLVALLAGAVVLSTTGLAAWLIDRETEPRRASVPARIVAQGPVGCYSRTRPREQRPVGPVYIEQPNKVEEYARQAIDALVPFWAAASQGRRQALAERSSWSAPTHLHKPWADDTGTFRALCA